MRRFFAGFGLPLLSKELTEMAQLRRTYVARVAFAVLIYLTSTLFFLPAYWAFRRTPQGFFGHGADVLDAIYAIEWGGLALFVPAIVSGALTAEKERNTLQLLFLTKLGPWTILFEKLLSRLVPVATFLLVSLPLLFIAYLLGGLTRTDLTLATTELVLTAFEIAAIAIFCSAYCATTAGAFILSYVLTAIVFLFPFLVYLALLLHDWFCVEIGAGHTALFAWLDSSANLNARVTLLTLTDGINLRWVFEQRAFGPSLVRPFHTTPQPFLAISAIGMLFLLLARSAVVRRAAPQPKHRIRRIFAWLDAQFTRLNNRYGKGILIASPDSGLPEANPISWREKRRGNLGRINYLVRVLVVIESPLLVISVLSAALGHDHNFTTLGTIGLVLWPIALLLIIVRAAGLVAAEKARQTLDVLLTTPLTLPELMGAKLRGLRRMKLIVAIPLVFQTLLIAWLRLAVGRSYYTFWDNQRQILETGGDAIFFLFVTGLNIVILFSLATQLAFLFGLYAKTQGRAVTAVLAVFVGFCFVPLIFRRATDDNWARDVMYLSPIADIVVNEFPREGVNFIHHQGIVLGTELPEWEFHPILHCALFAVIVSTLMAINRRVAAQVLFRPPRNPATTLPRRRMPQLAET